MPSTDALRPLARLTSLLAISCLGTAAALLGARALLERLPPLTPATATASLERALRWSPDPWRRREASLLLHARSEGEGRVERRRGLLRGQGWGSDPLAAVVLKHEALDAQALGRPELAEPLWKQLRRRFPGTPASADALYALGRERPALRQELLRRFPAHPAALAAALEAGPADPARRDGALHLARWGARWPGAEERLRQVCRTDATGLSAAQRAQLAQGLAELGDGSAALACLTPPGAAGPELGSLSDSGRLALARTLMRGDPTRKRLAERLLSTLVSRNPDAPEAEEAVRLLAQQDGPEIAVALEQLPPRWRESAPVQAHRILAGLEASAVAPGSGPAAGKPAAAGETPAAPQVVDPAAALAVLRRWPADPASWDLQWELARRLMLSDRWSEAETILRAIEVEQLPPPLAARARFWLGYSQRQLGQDEAATATWRLLRLHHPGGYYGWRAAVQLGEGELSLQPGGREPAEPWQPLASGDAGLDRLWRLDQRTEAWEAWRDRRGSAPPSGSAELLLEGRLRQGVGDDWTGLGQLEQASLRLTPQECPLLPQLDRSLHPSRFVEAFRPVAEKEGLPLALLLGVAKQESRFTPAVHSAAGAVGLLQLMPGTAAELAGGPLSGSELETPTRNAELGGRYLSGLLKKWKGDPVLAVASYNAGPGAVEGWIGPRLRSAPELWVEAIPYPETRLYVKKVLGNAWTYQEGGTPRC